MKGDNECTAVNMTMEMEIEIDMEVEIETEVEMEMGMEMDVEVEMEMETQMQMQLVIYKVPRQIANSDLHRECFWHHMLRLEVYGCTQRRSGEPQKAPEKASRGPYEALWR